MRRATRMSARPLPAQPMRPYPVPGRYRGRRRHRPGTRGDYLHGRWFWQEPHLRFLHPDTVWRIVDNQEGADPPDHRLRAEDEVKWMWRLLRDLPKEQRTILIRRFGLDRKPAESLQDVARRIGLGAERVRQLEATALRRLRDMIRRMDDAHDPRSADSPGDRAIGSFNPATSRRRPVPSRDNSPAGCSPAGWYCTRR